MGVWLLIYLFCLSYEYGPAWFLFYIHLAANKQHIVQHISYILVLLSFVTAEWMHTCLQETLTRMIPGQFGPIILVLFCLSNLCFTLTISCCGIPSVMTTASGTWKVEFGFCHFYVNQYLFAYFSLFVSSFQWIFTFFRRNISDLCIDGLYDSLCCSLWWYVNYWCVCSRLFSGLEIK